ncbi:hypothetical protein [Natrinema ejinorense]|uniref:DUF4382 domain-containing protein n=1 Tax=Natrinema ejinorense TaxID=373386 RepID=A0A2A5QWR2_9EURY|nr:hypothetical protein [Natrinema ejinorense]PCR91244.1 hypothetical protein CP557_12330 [Natrinema ejinorense]
MPSDAESDGSEPADSGDGNCDREPAAITDPDGDAMVAVTARESISYDTPDDGVTLDVSRIEFDGADVPTVVYEADRTVELWSDATDDTNGELTLLEKRPIPVGTYSGIRVYGSASVTEPSRSDDRGIRLSGGEYIEDVFGTVFQADDRTEFVFQTVLGGVSDENELEFYGRITTGW